jgi:CBS domain containing-hemolysin-like protein
LAQDVAAAAVVLLIAEAAARPIGRRRSAGVLRAVLPVLHVLSYPLRPTAWSGARRAEAGPRPEVVEAAREAVRIALADGIAEGAISAQERPMIEGVLRLRDVDVDQIMTPRADVEYVRADVPLQEAVRTLASFHHSRVPVCENTLDDVLGILYVRDLLAMMDKPEAASLPLRRVARPALFVPETNHVDTLLQKFREERVRIAVVVDEYGGTSGVVTVGDVLEEIVGGMADEYGREEGEDRIRVRSSGGVEVDARVRIDEVNAMSRLGIPEHADYDTVGGFVNGLFGRVPGAGDERRQDGLLVRILQADERRVRRVFLKRIEPGTPED